MTPTPDGITALLNLEPIKARESAAQRGPWRWNLNLKSRQITLEACVSGFEVVMDFVRWGMGGARVRFQRRGLMENVEEFAEIVPARAHHSHWFQTLSHPDANFIAHARTDVPALIVEVERLRALLASLPSERTWHPIETHDGGDREALFWIVPKTPEEAYCGTSGNPIFGTFTPYLFKGKSRCWSSLSKATHWMPLPSPPSEDQPALKTNDDDQGARCDVGESIGAEDHASARGVASASSRTETRMTPEARRLDDVVIALEALVEAGYRLHDRDGHVLERADFYRAIAIGLTAVLAHRDEVGLCDARST